MRSITESNNKPVSGAGRNLLHLTIPISPGWAQVDVWLKEKFGWSLAGWLEEHVVYTIGPHYDIEELVAGNLEEKFHLPRSEMALNMNEILKRLGRPVHEFDPANRIVYVDVFSGPCPRCKGTSHFMLGQLVIEGKIQFVGCNVCLERDGYLPKYPIA